MNQARARALICESKLFHSVAFGTHQNKVIVHTPNCFNRKAVLSRAITTGLKYDIPFVLISEA